MAKENHSAVKSEYYQPVLEMKNASNSKLIESKSSTYAFENLSLDQSLPSNDNSQLFDKDSSPDLIIINRHFAKYMTKQELIRKLERVIGELIQPMIVGRELFFMNSTEGSKTALEIEPTHEEMHFEKKQ